MIQHKPKNKRERRVAEEYEREGWEVLHKGWPDFLMFRNGEIRLIEVKRKQRRKTKKMGLSEHQNRVKQILEKVLAYEVRYED